MFKTRVNQMILPHEFLLPFTGELNADNDWCRLALMIPWSILEERYGKTLRNNKTGRNAFSVRMALGALIIQNRKKLSDRDTVQEITENPYLQYFVGLTAFILKAPFNPSLMVLFRKRLGEEIIREVNELIAIEAAKAVKRNSNDDDNKPDAPKPPVSAEEADSKTEPVEPAGTLILDATCAPADIHYPTDIFLLNEAREKLEEIIDDLHVPLVGKMKKPRTYRECARRAFLRISKNKRPTKRDIRKAIGKQLRYIKRDLRIIQDLASQTPLTVLSRQHYKNLLVCTEVYRQQAEMYSACSHKVDDRIVSIQMPFVRPIVRGKAQADVEFGAKVAISVVNGYVFLEQVSFDAFNEGTTLADSLERHEARFGAYPKEVIADKIYRNRENLRLCKEKGIRLSGPPLGRPAKDAEVRKEQQRFEREDAGIRNWVEGKFGEGKRTFGLGRIMSHLAETSQTVIAMQFLVMNLERKLRLLLCRFLLWHYQASKLPRTVVGGY